MLLQDKVLILYDPELPLVLATGSSSYNLGAVLSHRTLRGEERTIAYATRSLSGIEEKYLQIEKESLSLVWGVKKFQTYLEGRNFTLVTDQQPLKYIMDPGRAVSVTAAARIQRWCLFVVAFSYRTEFRGTTRQANCDGLSRIPQARDQLIGQMKWSNSYICGRETQYFLVYSWCAGLRAVVACGTDRYVSRNLSNFC